MQLAGKVVLVSGGGSGAGAAIARRFAEAGAQVIIVGRDKAKLDAASAAIGAAHSVQALAGDVADRARVDELVAQVVAEHGRIDVLVNNAGVNIVERALGKLAPDNWDYLMNVNATGAYNMIHAVLPTMRSQKAGLIINITSIAGMRVSALAGAAYTASKHAMIALSKAVAVEEGANGIRSTSIAPGDINTPLLEFRPNPVSDEHRARILQPDDIAAAAFFVATLPDHVCIPEMVITPIGSAFG